ncbi:hypothetical protein C1Y63_12055 [Corynebacterium sp. 13CS0277]|uniref:DsbA family protein n=1 Tax=Corynebacterium sp. 13CS0277 TaxID=2071994 RepID=UPI000D02AECC|nr:thioredoxin domain-containing protein [Corynebacterium sp. 13CS0277]PRQ10331.1 hypothetical protein C1Y63_12055 [Corynebacterium sp. 13CS0277]
MSTTIKSPNEKSKGFIWALLAVVVVIAGVVTYIVMNGEKAADEKLAADAVDNVGINVTYNDNMIRLAAKDAKPDTPTADLYEDFSCPHCSELAEATDADMLKAVQAGDLVVNIHPMNFLDRGDENGHSTRAGAAALAIAQDGDATDYWNYRAMLMRDQSKIWNQWDNAKFAEAATALKVKDDVTAEIAEGKDLEQMREVGTKNAEKLKEQTGRVSSPRVIVDGKDVEDISNWVQEVSGK